ncbi:MAG: hypothetical protein K2P81_06155 [Bacteriovoracaceae bacterium]|nr:hypothetical protein [Bacteriovoracaceae bacterium]
MQVQWFDEKYSVKTNWVNYCCLIVLFAFNFLGFPSLKYVYLAYSFIVYLSVLFFNPATTLPLIISYGFVEGQGRILWGYHPAARIAFDLLIVLATLRGFVTRRDVKLARFLPIHMLFLISLHFLWYLVEIFNISGINTLAAIAGTKVYVFPFFLLIYFRQNEAIFTSDYLQKISNLILFLLILECALGIFQLQNLEGFLLDTSEHYRRAMRGDIFTLDKFRPFGTTQLPGAISVFIFLSMGLIFLRKKFQKWMIAFLVPVFYLFFIVLIICQVRSAMIKTALVLVGILISLFINSKEKMATIVRVSSIAAILIPVAVFFVYPKIEKQVEAYINLEAGFERWEGLDEVNDVSKHRLTPSQVADIMFEKLYEFPIGVGPAMTGASGSLSTDLIQKDPIYDKNTFWGYDNFYLSLVIEFGYGAIFYIAYFLSVPLALMYFLKVVFLAKDFQSSKVISICLVNILIILAGNWGAIGLSYNPESFFFWLWTAIGFNTYYLAQKSQAEAVTA